MGRGGRHDAPALAPEFPVPLGVFRAVGRPVHHELDQAHLASARERKGLGDLAKLLHQDDTWNIR